ncbi:Myb-like domain containing protein [Trema orientale]|uniref:Myb-like domain containing protein n=1 Tax=Trema orientale TaxID=63057 RepID=A0A2P5B1A6_TREOI|nr:Myb-like domain containing protein [Trema orientale]
MQSNYEIAEIIPEQPQFMDSDCSSPLVFPLPNPSIQNHHYPLHHHHHQDHDHHNHCLLHPHQPIDQHHQYSQVLLKRQFQYPSSSTSTPFTHQFFQPWQRRVEEQETVRPNHQTQVVRAPQLNFKLGLNENSTSSINNAPFALGGGESYLLGGNQQFHHFPEKQTHFVESKSKYCRQAQEYSTAKEPFWNSVAADISVLNTDNDKSSRVDVREICKELEDKYRLNEELEAIHSLAKIGEVNNTGSGSALTGEESPSPADVSIPAPSRDIPCDGGANVSATHGSTDEEASIGEEASLMKKLRNKKRKRKTKGLALLSSMTRFFEGLVKQVMGHQDRLHGNFMESIERIDKERREREEVWRREEAQTHNREAIARVHEQALASNREARIVSHIEKITGQRVNLPSRNIAPLLLKPDLVNESLEESMPIDEFDTNRRWPRSEVEALIQVRSSLELKFQEPGLKGPRWEEVSALMASMGYKRSAKRCKEKWENINKYFRKTKHSSATKGSHQNSKTCSYFDQLDQLYSRTTPHNYDVSSSSSHCSKPLLDGFGAQSQSYIELLEAFSARKDEVGVTQRTLSSGNFEIAEIGSGKLDFEGHFHENVEFEREDHDRQKLNHVEDEDFEDEFDED